MKCLRCGYNNEDSVSVCSACKAPLILTRLDLDKLEAKHNALREKFQVELDELKSEILYARSLYEREQEIKFSGKPKIVEEPLPPIPEIKEEPLPVVSQVVEEKIPTPIKEEKTKPKPAVEETELSQHMAAPEPEKSFRETHPGLMDFIAPLHSGIEMLAQVYDRYKKEGKLPLFFMTIAGIVALLFGFGYLMQMTFDKLGVYSVVAKVSSGFVSSIGILFFARWLYRKKEDYQEFASALIGLSVLLNYLLIYFLSGLSDFPMLSSVIVGFTLIVANTSIAILFALKYETRVVAILSLIGGAFTPMVFGSDSGGTFYFAYLWLLTLGAVYVARKIKWNQLTYIAFVLAAGLLETSVFKLSNNEWLFTGYIELYALTFFLVVAKPFGKGDKLLVAADWVVLISNLSLLVVNLYQLHGDADNTLGFLYLINIGLFVIPFFRWKELLNDLKYFSFVSIGALVGFAIPALIHIELMGLCWSVEGLLLLLVGNRFVLPFVRKEGMVVLLIGLAKMLYSFGNIEVVLSYHLWTSGFINFVLTGVIALVLLKVKAFKSEELSDIEGAVFRGAANYLPLWSLAVFYLAGFHYLKEWVLPMAIVPVLGLTYWSKKTGKRWIYHLALLQNIGFLIAYGWSAYQVSSMRLRHQELYAQISLIFFWTGLWWQQWLVAKMDVSDSKILGLTSLLRKIFYWSIPFIVWSRFIRYLPDFAITGGWISAWLCFGLQLLTKEKSLKTQLYILLGVSMLGSLLKLEAIAMILGVLTLVGYLVREQCWDKKKMEKHPMAILIAIIPVYIPLLMAINVSGFASKSFAMAGMYVGGVVLWIFTLAQRYIYPVGKNFSVYLFGTTLATLFMNLILLESSQPVYVMLSVLMLVFIGAVIARKDRFFETIDKSQWPYFFGLGHLTLAAFYTGVLLHQEYSFAYSIILVVHAVGLTIWNMRLKMQVVSRISVAFFAGALGKIALFDIRGLETTQKVIVLIIIGITLLGGSFAFVRLKERWTDGEKVANESDDDPKP